MYKFEITTDLDQFDRFVKENGGSILQTSKGANLKSDWLPYFVIGKKENEVVFSCLVLTKRKAKFFRLGYIPLGFVCNYEDEKLVVEALDFLSSFAKEEKLDICFIDPTVSLEIDGEKQKKGERLANIFEKHGLSKTRNRRPFIQPDTTYIIDLQENDKKKSLDNIVAGFEKSLRQSIKSAPSKGLTYASYSYPDIESNEEPFEEFSKIMNETMERLSSQTRSDKYLYRILKELSPYARLNMVYYNYQIDENNCKEYEKELSNLPEHLSRAVELKSKIDGFKKRVDELEKKDAEFDKKGIALAGGITVSFGDTAVCLYGGSKNLLRNTAKPSQYLNFKRIEGSMENNLKYHDLARVYLKRRDKSDPNFGLHLFKKSYGAREHRYIGEYAFVGNRIFYWVMLTLLPTVRKIAAIFQR